MKTSINNIIFNIRRKLPEPIKKPLRWIYHKWNIKIDQDTVEYLGEYYSLKQKGVQRLLRIAGRLNADFWRCLNPKTEEEVKRFYEDTPFYVFNLTFWHSTKYQRNLRLKFTELAHGKVLDYGGGTGDLCVRIAEKGLSVDYADLQGKTFDFAKWLFQRKNYDVGMINLSNSQISKQYDTIFCIDVVEHVKNPKVLLKNLVEHLEKNGKLVITALHPEMSEDVPMHFEIEFNPEKYLKSLGMAETDDPFVWIKTGK